MFGDDNMIFSIKADEDLPGQYTVLVNQIAVGTMNYHEYSRTGWYEDEERGHFALIFEVEYSEMVASVRKYYE